MNKKELEKLFYEWKQTEEGKLNSKRVNKLESRPPKRGYIHFDKRGKKPSINILEKSLQNPEVIKQVGFWPFIQRTIITPRYKTKINKNGKKYRVKDPKKRLVYYSAHKDALIYSWYAYLLNYGYYEKYLKQKNIDKCAIAYRKVIPSKCNIHFSKEVFDFVKDKGVCAVFVSDISNFFDTLDHEHLKKEWSNILGISNTFLPIDHYTIYKNLTSFKYVNYSSINKAFDISYKRETSKVALTKASGKIYYDTKVSKIAYKNGCKINSILAGSDDGRKEFEDKIVNKNLIKGNSRLNNISTSSKFRKVKCGIMQGAPISAVLANIYMISFDEEINKLAIANGGIYRRYSDDIVVVCDLGSYDFVKNKVEEIIKKYELEINPKKTKTTFFLKNDDNVRGYCDTVDSKYKNLQFLGFEFDGQRIYLRNSSLSNYYRKMKWKIGKAIEMAYGKNSKTINDDNRVYKQKMVKKYLYKGRSSFISYAIRSASILKSNSVKKQLSGRFRVFFDTLFKKTSKAQKNRDTNI